MQLLGPAPGGIPAAKFQHEVRAVFRLLFRGHLAAIAGGAENFRGLRVGAGRGVAVLQSMIRKTAARFMEIVMAFLQGREQIVKGGDRRTGRSLQFFEPEIERRRLADLQGLVRSERGIDFRRKAAGANGVVMLQRIGRVIRGAENADIMLLQEIVHAQVWQLRIALAPDGLRRIGTQQIGDAEVARQFKMSPMVERIAERIRHRRRPSLELFLRRGVAGDIFFRHAVRPHGPPLVVVARQPDIREIGELMVLRDLGGGEVIVEIDDGLRGGKLMVKRAGRFVVQQKVVVNEGAFHDYGFKVCM